MIPLKPSNCVSIIKLAKNTMYDKIEPMMLFDHCSWGMLLENLVMIKNDNIEMTVWNHLYQKDIMA